MFIAAIKCDFCKKAHEIPCRKSGDKPDVPDGWATISPTVRIKGTTQNKTCNGKKWNKETEKFDLEPCKKEERKRNEYTERRDKLRSKFDKSHVCLDCIEEVFTGRRSIKIEMKENN